jgi:ribosomal-protein-alanine N-acetyltransferase
LIATARLAGLPPEPGHHEALALVLQDPRVAETLWPGALGGPRTDAQTRARLDDFIGHWREHGFGPWMFFTRDRREPVGYAGPRRTEVEGEDAIELVYAVASAWWGRGLGTEMARAAVAHAGVDDLVCFTLATNRASRRVMQKAGFRYERDFVRAGLPHVLYRLPVARGAK